MSIAAFFALGGRLGLRRRTMALVVGLGMAQTLFEAGAVLLLLPAMQFIQSQGDVAALVARHWYWGHLRAGFDAVGATVSLSALLVLAFASILMRQAMQYAHRVVLAAARAGLVRDIRIKLFTAALQADLSATEGDNTGRLVAEVSTEADTAATALFYRLQLVVLCGVFAIYLASLLSLSWQMTAASLAVFGVTAALVAPFIRGARGHGLAVSEANQNVGAFLVERLRAVRAIQLANSESVEVARARGLLDGQARSLLGGERLAAKVPVLVEPIFVGLAFASLWFGASRLGLGLETLGLFLVIVMRLVPIGKDLVMARQVIVQTSPALELVDGGLARLEAARPADTGTARPGPAREGIRFEGVRYVYGDGRTALAGVDLFLPGGRMTALVGPSGGGKSTLVDLLPRIRHATSGRVTIDGLDLDAFRLADLRRAIAFVSQSPTLFDGTIADHVRYTAPGASDEEVRAALGIAQALDFVDAMPKGLATRIGEAGALLSGGQRQRLDLARAIAQRAPILILDEPTSALDAESDRRFGLALDRLRAERSPTIVVVAHRLATIASADQIVVMDGGRVIERGTHDELVAAGGWYADAWSTQTAGSSGHIAFA